VGNATDGDDWGKDDKQLSIPNDTPILPPPVVQNIRDTHIPPPPVETPSTNSDRCSNPKHMVE